MGQKSEKTITHAASPIGISLHEKTMKLGFGYVMDQPLITTSLKQGIAFQQEYKVSGVYFGDSPEEYEELYIQLTEGHYPKGEYIITATAKFNDITSDSKQEYELQVSTSFKVVE